MGLTLQKLQALEDAELTKLFEDKKPMWTTMYEQAFAYTKQFVDPSKEPVRQDDVLPVLKPVLNVCDDLREFLDGKKLRQNYWYTYFGDLIIDRLWNK